MNHKMKIAHISILPAFSPGIFKKLEDKAKISRENNLGIDFYLLNPEKALVDKNLYVMKQEYKYIPFRFLKTVFFRLFKMCSIMKLIRLEEYDAIVLRYPLVDGFCNTKYALKYGKKTITEHHTNEISELIAVGRPIDILRAFIEKNFSGNFLSKMAGCIGVTNEIVQIQAKKIDIFIPRMAIANGINPDSYKKIDFVSFDKKTLKMLFIATEFSPWHGLESILNAIANYTGECNITLHLVGSVNQNQRKIIQDRLSKSVEIVIHGKLYGEDLDRLFIHINIAISSLSMSKNNMLEGSTLKSREYIVRGIPFIYAYKDTDLVGDEIFAKRFEETKINIEEIIQFASDVSIQREDVLKAMAQKEIDISWLNKLKQIKSFVEQNL